MVERINGLPDRYMGGAFPHNDRFRSQEYFGVTEVIYCIRRSFLQRVVPVPTEISFEKRILFARGHALESAFFGDQHNSEYFVGDNNMCGVEGHADHIVRNSKDEIDEIVEFKSVRRLWYKAPNGKAYYSLGMAKKAIDKSDWDKIEHRYNDSHMDQLKMYMIISGAPRGVLIYYELSTDKNYTWIITADEITDEFKERMADRLKILKECYDKGVVPEKLFLYDWECGLCSFNESGVCNLCDAEGFDLDAFCNDVTNSNNFDEVVNSYKKKYGDS